MAAVDEIAAIVRAYAREGTVLGAVAASGRDRNTVRKHLRRLGLLDPAPAEARPLPAEVVAEVRGLLAAHGGDAAAAAAAAGWRLVVLRRLVDRCPPPEGVEDYQARQDGEGGLAVQFRADRPIRTPEEIYRLLEIDPARWRVKELACRAWTTSMRLRRKDQPDEPLRVQNYLVAVTLVPAMDAARYAAVASLFDAMARHAPRYPKQVAVARPKSARPHMAVFDLFDSHFGQYAWGLETGQAQDLKLSDRVYRDAFSRLVDYASPWWLERIVIPLGNDLVHIDSGRNQTTGGTPQDVDTRHPKVFEVAYRAVIWGIEYLLGRTPRETTIVVPWVESNHDEQSAHAIAHVVAAWFRNEPRVAVDTGPRSRKAVAYGRNLVAFQHGHTPAARVSGLPGLLAQEWPDLYAQATACREWHLGHDHTAKKVETPAKVPSDFGTYPATVVRGVTMRWIRALCAPSAWAYKMGYFGDDRAAEAYFYDRDHGYVGQHVARVAG